MKKKTNHFSTFSLFFAYMSDANDGEGALLCANDKCKLSAIKYCEVCSTPVCLRHSKSCSGCAALVQLRKVCIKKYEKRYRTNTWLNKLPGDQWLFYMWIFAVFVSPLVMSEEVFQNVFGVLAACFPVGLSFYCCCRKKYDDFEDDWMDSAMARRLLDTVDAPMKKGLSRDHLLHAQYPLVKEKKNKKKQRFFSISTWTSKLWPHLEDNE